MSAAIEINSRLRGPLVVPLHNIKFVSRAKDDLTAVVETQSGSLMETHDPFETISKRMTSSAVWGIVSTLDGQPGDSGEHERRMYGGNA